MSGLMIHAGIVLLGGFLIFAAAMYLTVKNNARIKREREEAQA